MANGWLSPTGEFFPCPIGGHGIMAQELIAGDNAETWVAVSPSSAFSELPLTEAQILWLKSRPTYQVWLALMLEIQADNEVNG